MRNRSWLEVSNFEEESSSESGRGKQDLRKVDAGTLRRVVYPIESNYIQSGSERGSAVWSHGDLFSFLFSLFPFLTSLFPFLTSLFSFLFSLFPFPFPPCPAHPLMDPVKMRDTVGNGSAYSDTFGFGAPS